MKEVIINTKGKTDGFSQKVINFIEYINHETVTDDFTKRLNEKVKRWRLDNEKARAYMTYEQEILEAEARGRAKGKAEGEFQKAISIAEDMLRDGASSQNIQKYTKLPLERIQELAAKLGVELD